MADDVPAAPAEPLVPPAASRGSFGFSMRLLAGAAVFAALLGIGSVPVLLSDTARLSRLVAGATPELQADVTIGRARIGWIGPIVLEDVRVVPRDGAVEPLCITRIEGAHGLAAMLLSWGDIGRIRLTGVEGHLAFDADRQSNLVNLVVPRATGSAAPAAPRRSPVRMRLEADDAVLRITGPWTLEPWASEPITLRAALAPSPDGATSAWTVEPVEVFTDARMEPGVAQGVLAYVAPVLADAARTSGRFSLWVDGARFPVGDPDGATFSGKLAMHEVALGPGPLVLGILEALPGRLPAPPTVRVADESHVVFRLENRRVWHDGLEFGLPLAKPGQRLDVASSGWVNLADGALDVMLRLPIPADLPQDRPLISALAGKTISVGIGGVLGEPRINFNGSIRATAGEVVAELVDRLRGGVPQRAEQPRPFPRPQPPTAAQPRPAPDQSAPPSGADAGDGSVKPATGTTQAGDVIDLVGGVLEEVARRRAERRAAEEENPAAAPPRGIGGGLLRGRLRRDAQAPAPEPQPNP
jgi:hypothetical protein